MVWGGRRGDGTIVAPTDQWSASMPQPNDLGRSLVALDQDSTLVAVRSSYCRWLRRWKKEAETAGRTIKRTAVAYEAGRDGFWLARWLRARGIEAYVIHPSSVPVSREHR